jgi:uncharacterized protein YndB with AHSA1/START domain
MMRIETTRSIRAPREEVFDATAHIEHYAEVIPAITGVEFLTEQRVGRGTRFRETRRMGRRSATTELEVTDYERPTRVRMVADAGGTVWDTTFTYLNTTGGTDIHLQMDARPHTIPARLLARFFRRAVIRGLEGDLDAVKAHFERAAATP